MTMEYIINLEQNMEEEKVKDIQLEISVNQQVKEMLVAEELIEIEIMEMEANLIMMKDVVLVKVLEKWRIWRRRLRLLWNWRRWNSAN